MKNLFQFVLWLIIASAFISPTLAGYIFGLACMGGILMGVKWLLWD